MNAWVAAGVAALLLLSRLCHLRVLWVEEAYPMTGALQMLAGQMPYRDFWYDKPPLVPLFYLLCGAYDGWPLRLLGAAFALVCCYVAFRFARDVWDERAGRWAAALMAFFLTFDQHAATIAIAPDVFLLLPHLSAVWLAFAGHPLLAGLVLALGLAANVKAIFLLPVCLLFSRRHKERVLFGLMPAAFLLLLPGFREQVLAWGAVYSADTFVADPLATGLTRTLAWCGFHVALLVGAYFARPPAQWIVWIALMLVTVALGLRFSPRYYFALLPPLVLLAARGITLTRRPLWVAALLLIPLVRFGPRYGQLAMGQPWPDLALLEDAKSAVAQMGPAKSVFVWGYRPEINVLAHAHSQDFYIESQPLTGVFADRHLTSAKRSARPRPMPMPLRSEYVVDGLGPLNPMLKIPEFALAGYEIAGRTRTAIIYRSTRAGASPEKP